MAIYHFTAQVIGRSAGRSSVSAAAYRSGETLVDERTGEICRPRRRERVAHAQIIAPADAPEWAADRGKTWNSVEARDTRKNSQLAREFEMALPRELNEDQRLELVQGWIDIEFTQAGVVADLAIHTDEWNHNPHCHIMTTMRPLSADGWGDKLRAWNDRSKIEQWRESWADHTNRALERAGIDERVDHRTLEAQGIERKPTVKEGYAARQMEERGAVSDRMAMNRQIRAWNRQLRERAAAAIQAGKASLETMAKKLQAKPADRAKPAFVDDLRAAAKARPATSMAKHDVVSGRPQPAAAVEGSKPKPPRATAPKQPSHGPSPKSNEDDGADISTQQAWLAGKGPKGR